MKTIIAMWMLLAAPAFAAPLPPDLAKALRDYDRAQFDNDIPGLQRLLSDDYVLVNSDASVQDKQEVLSDHRMPGFRIDPYVLEQPIRQVSNDAAVIGGLAHLRWTQDGKRQTRVIRIAYVWAKRNGQWQTTYTQVTRVPGSDNDGVGATSTAPGTASATPSTRRSPSATGCLPSPRADDRFAGDTAVVDRSCRRPATTCPPVLVPPMSLVR